MGDVKNTRKYGAIAGAVVIIIVVIAVALFAGYMNSGTAAKSYQQGSTSVANTGNASSLNSNAIMLSDTPYAQYAYLISDANLSSSARQAISGFNMSRDVLANGSIRITFYPFGSNTPFSNYTIGANNKLYYIDSSFGDDSPPSGEYSLGDDGIVETNSTGYLVKPQ